ncbi:MAG: hypothetical protein ABSE17_04570 [Candidatus Levyibacteriota bacterium]|jgi:hypothetical protein
MTNGGPERHDAIPAFSPSRTPNEPTPTLYNLKDANGNPAQVLVTDRQLEFSIAIPATDPDQPDGALGKLTCERWVNNSKTIRIVNIRGDKQTAHLLLFGAHEIAKSNGWALMISDKAGKKTRELLTTLEFDKNFRVELSLGI